MRVETIEVKVYKYNELSEESKQTVKNWYLDQQESRDFTEIVLDDLQWKYGVKDLKPYFSLEYCQGGGLCLVGSLYAYDGMSKETWKYFTKGLKGKQIQIANNEISSINFIKRNHHYCHSKAVSIEIEKIRENKNHEKIFDTVQKNVQAWYDEQIRQIEREAEYFFSENKIKYTDEENSFIADANNIRFDKDGYIIETD